MSDGYGTVMVGRLKVPFDEVAASIERWIAERKVPGFRHEDLMLCADGVTVIASVHFDDEASYRALAADPEQARWWAEVASQQLDGDPQWFDGAWRACLSPS